MSWESLIYFNNILQWNCFSQNGSQQNFDQLHPNLQTAVVYVLTFYSLKKFLNKSPCLFLQVISSVS